MPFAARVALARSRGAAAAGTVPPAAVAEGATLVDLYQAFGGTPDPLIDADGLHPNAMGYQKMGETFFTTIRSMLELSTTTSR